MGSTNVTVSLSLAELNDLHYSTAKYVDQCEGMEKALQCLYTLENLNKARALHDKIGRALVEAVKKSS